MNKLNYNFKETRETIFEFIRTILSKHQSKDGNYDYIVLTTRRCFCIYNAFSKDKFLRKKHRVWFALNRNKLIELDKKIISSQKIDIIGADFEGKNVLLVDDIMIHGQTVYSFYEKISDFKASNIDTLVMIRNIERPDYYYFKTEQKEYTSLHNKLNWNWREVSNDIVSFLHESDQLYISYVYGYEIKKDILDKITHNEKLEEIQTNFSRYIKHSTYNKNQHPKYYNVCQSYDFLKYSFLRVYPMLDSNDIFSIIPYAELRDFKVSCLNSIWKKIWKSDEVPVELKEIKTTADKFKSLTVISSLAIYKNLLKNLDLNMDIVETKEIDKSFVENFISIIQDNIREDVLDVINKEFVEASSTQNFYDNSIMYKKLGAVSFENENVESNFKALEMYFYAVSEEEEEVFVDTIKAGVMDGELKKFELEKGKTTTLNTGVLYSKLPQTNQKLCQAFLIYLMDNGVISHVVEERCGYVMTTAKAGEQSYHLFSDLTGSAFRPVYYFLKQLKTVDDMNLKNEFIDKAINELENSSIIDDVESIVFVLKNQPVKLNSSYLGIIERHIDSLSEERLEEEKQFAEIFESII